MIIQVVITLYMIKGEKQKMDPRKAFFDGIMQNPNSRILELGPLINPIAEKNKYPNTFYVDIRSTEDVKKLYSGNEYLEKTGISIDPEQIVPIDYVVQNTYSKTFENIEKFDYIIASHVLEHIPDLIFALQDISKIMKPGGTFVIIYPDKRYCFDHFRTSASFREAYHVYQNGSMENSPMVLDFFYSAIPENDPVVFWNNDNLIEKYIPKSDFQDAVSHYEQAMAGVKMDDVHYWPFADMEFLKFLYDCTRAHLLPFLCTAFQPCLRNDQQFMLALKYDPSVLEDTEQAQMKLTAWMEKALPDYYTSKAAALIANNARLQEELDRVHEEVNHLTMEKDKLQQKEKTLQKQNQSLSSKLDTMTRKYEIISTSTIWRSTAPLRIVLDWIKRAL